MNGTCRICGEEKEGQAFDAWVKDTFTNLDLCQPGEIICNECLFWFDQHSTELQRRMGKEKPQKMQNYSHFIVGGEWQPVGKGDKAKMASLLLSDHFPELAAIAVSGQKHVAFRARRNPPGQSGGWVQFEEQSLWVDPVQLTDLLKTVEELYTVFSKGEIESGAYIPSRILEFGVERWDELEQKIKAIRKTSIFQLAIFFAQRSEDDRDESDDGSNAAENHLERGAGGIQEEISANHLDPIRERDPGGGLHQQPGEVHQLDLFAPPGGSW